MSESGRERRVQRDLAGTVTNSSHSGRLWRIGVLTDGKAGDRVQCLGVAEAVAARLGGSVIDEREVHPRPSLAWAMPWGPMDPRDRAAIAPPHPDVAIASGRRCVPVLRALKREAPSCLTVFLKDPRTGTGAADLIWVPEHDRLRGPNVLVSVTSPHRITAETLAEAAAGARAELLALPRPRVAVLLGGASRGVTFGEGDVRRLADGLRHLALQGAGLMITPSRRTPPQLRRALAAALEGTSHWFWDGRDANPYVEMLGLADAILVTADSTNMVSEAAITGRPIHLFMPKSLPRKHQRFLAAMERHGAVVKFHGHLETTSYQPLDSTPLIAAEIVRRLQSRSLI
jgi:mitochondrial fission protein ELM1